MILLHRITPFAIAGLLAAGFSALTLAPFTWGIPAVVCFAIVPFLFGRLLLWDMRRPGFWVFLGVPTFFLLSSLAFFLLLEWDPGKWLLGGVVTLGLALFAENLFSFYHLPSAYQAYSLEYLSLMIAIAGMFFAASASYLGLFFLEFPLPAAAAVMFVILMAVHTAIFWVSKISWDTARFDALAGALIMTQMYVVFAWLPTGFTTNAAAFAVMCALYLSVMRAYALDKLTRNVFLRHSVFAAVLLLIIFVTAPWR